MQRIFIKSDPEIMMGKPVIASTRITVELILEKLSSGESIKQVLNYLIFYHYFQFKSSRTGIVSGPIW